MPRSATNITSRAPLHQARLVAVACLAAGCRSPLPTLPPGGDGDGFFDSVDRCQWEAGPDGCPLLDTDGDLLLDPDDNCPKEPETRNGYKDEDGCPDEIPTVKARFTGTTREISFNLDNTLRANSRGTLDRATEVMKEIPSMVIGITCYKTVSHGGRKAARLDTQARARAIKTYLVEQGIADHRIGILGGGADKPADVPASTLKRGSCIFTIVPNKTRLYDGPLSVNPDE